MRKMIEPMTEVACVIALLFIPPAVNSCRLPSVNVGNDKAFTPGWTAANAICLQQPRLRGFSILSASAAAPFDG
jgi:hypothetical protein